MYGGHHRRQWASMLSNARRCCWWTTKVFGRCTPGTGPKANGLSVQPLGRASAVRGHEALLVPSQKGRYNGLRRRSCLTRPISALLSLCSSLQHLSFPPHGELYHCHQLAFPLLLRCLPMRTLPLRALMAMRGELNA